MLHDSERICISCEYLKNARIYNPTPPPAVLGGKSEQLNWNCHELNITVQVMTAHRSHVLSKSQVQSMCKVVDYFNKCHSHAQLKPGTEIIMQSNQVLCNTTDMYYIWMDPQGSQSEKWPATYLTEIKKKHNGALTQTHNRWNDHAIG